VGIGRQGRRGGVDYPDPRLDSPLGGAGSAPSGLLSTRAVGRGTTEGGALPSIGIYLKEEKESPADTARLPERRWPSPAGGPTSPLRAWPAKLSVRFET